MKKHTLSCAVVFLSVLVGLVSFGMSVYWTISPNEATMQAYHWFLVLCTCVVVGVAAFIVATATNPQESH